MGQTSSSGYGGSSNEKVERLFRANKRTSRSRSLDTRTGHESARSSSARPVGGSHSARFPKNAHSRYATTRVRPHAEAATPAPVSCQSGLTNEHKRILGACWMKATPKQIKRATEDIFAEILDNDRTLFALFRLDDVPSSRLRESEVFVTHAAAFAVVLDLAIKNAQESIETCCAALQALGAQHVALRERGFDSLYWDLFTDCFERHPPASFKTDADRDAWSHMILFVLAQMKLGFRQMDRKPDRLSVVGL